MTLPFKKKGDIYEKEKIIAALAAGVVMFSTPLVSIKSAIPSLLLTAQAVNYGNWFYVKVIN